MFFKFDIGITPSDYGQARSEFVQIGSITTIPRLLYSDHYTVHRVPVETRGCPAHAVWHLQMPF